MKAIRLINTEDLGCTFEEGSIPELGKIAADHFYLQTTIENYELKPHPAPRYQFVVTLKGTLRFTVSDGSSFILAPGVILVAKDVEGKGHSWEIIEGNEWHRIYIVPAANSPDPFIPG